MTQPSLFDDLEAAAETPVEHPLLDVRRIWAEPEPGKRVRICFELPRAPAAAPSTLHGDAASKTSTAL